MQDKTITNLSNGILPTDAVNMRQLKNINNIRNNLNMNQHKITDY